ncbi:MAG: peptidoglycan-binding domain-containing protein [Minisyncoccia bacterium]
MLKKISFSAVGLSLLVSPLLTSADTISDVQAQINALLFQLAALQTQQSGSMPQAKSIPTDDYGTGSSVSAACPNLSMTMQRGSRDATTGGQVSALQIFLANNFGLNDDDVVTGYFGATTEKYLKLFQAKHELPVYGIAGSLTRTAIARVCGIGVQSSPFPTPTLPQPTVSMSPSSQNIQYGQDVFITISSANVNSCTVYADGVASEGFTPNVTQAWPVNSYESHLYSVTCISANGQAVSARASVTVNNTQQTSPITVTSPNGGEQWEIGQLNTITWAPYGYNPNVNPANGVDVYLLNESGGRVGKVMDTGKASLHTYFNIDNYQTWAKPGRYYVEAINRVTGAKDRTDAPFTLLPRTVDIKVNGSDGPVTLTDNQPVVVTYQTNGNSTSCELQGLRKTLSGSPVAIPIGTASTLGQENGYTYAPTPGSSTAIYATCRKPDGTTRSDSVQVNMGGSVTATSVQITTPNGGEKIDPKTYLNIDFRQTGLKSYSVALYKNDQWKFWIKKDIPIITNKDVPEAQRMTWDMPGDSIQGLGEGDNAGAIWKIYVTGLKSDGSGYVDDKSDTPFSFGAPSTPTPSCVITANKSSYTYGETIGFSWTSTNATYATFLPDTSGKDNLKVPGDKLPANGSQPIVANVSGNPYVTLAVYGANGEKATCTKTVPVTGGPTPVTSLYSLSVYNATNGKSDFCYSDWGTINVTIAADAKSPLVLALDSYEPTKWNIINASGKKIQKIITTGYHAQMVAGAVSGIPVEHHTMYQIGKAGKLTYNSNDFFYKVGATMPSRLYDWPTEASCKTTSGAIPLASRMYFTAQNDYALGAGSATSGEYKAMLQKLKTWSGGLTPTASRAIGTTASFTVGAMKVSYLQEQLALEGANANVASAAAAYQQLIDVLSDMVSFLGQ